MLIDSLFWTLFIALAMVEIVRGIAPSRWSEIARSLLVTVLIGLLGYDQFGPMMRN